MLYFISDTILRNELVSQLRLNLRRLEQEQIPYVIFGTGQHTQEIIDRETFDKSYFKGFAADVGGSMFRGYPVHALSDLETIGIRAVFISSFLFQEEIYQKINPVFNGEIIKIYDFTAYLKKREHSFRNLTLQTDFQRLLSEKTSAVFCVSYFESFWALGLLGIMKKINPAMEIIVAAGPRLVGISSQLARDLRQLYSVDCCLLGDHDGERHTGAQLDRLFLDYIRFEPYTKLKLAGTDYHICENVAFDRFKAFMRDHWPVKKDVEQLLIPCSADDSLVVASDCLEDPGASFIRRQAARSGIPVVGYNERPLGNSYHTHFYPSFHMLVARNQDDADLITRSLNLNIPVLFPLPPTPEDLPDHSLPGKNFEKNEAKHPPVYQNRRSISIVFNLKRQVEMRILARYLRDYAADQPIALVVYYINIFSNVGKYNDREIFEKSYRQFLEGIPIHFSHITYAENLSGETVIMMEPDNFMETIARDNTVIMFDPMRSLEQRFFAGRKTVHLVSATNELFQSTYRNESFQDNKIIP